MPSFAMLKAAGLHSSNNIFSSAPEGGLLVAKNVVIGKNHVVESRRGQVELTYRPETGAQLNSLGFFGTTLHVHDHDNGSLWTDTGSGFASVAYGSASFSAVDNTLLRMKFVEARNHLYVNTSGGSVVVDTVGGDARSVGLPKPMFYWKQTFNSTAGLGVWIPTANMIASRLVFGFYDADGNETLGPPSDRAVISNSSGSNSYFVISFVGHESLPQSSNYFVRVYRTELLSTTGVTNPDPGDEMFLASEIPFTTYGVWPGTSGLGTSLDRYNCATILGDEPLYTNPRTGDGILQANSAPPIAKDICWWKNRQWLGNTVAPHRLYLDILGTGSPFGIQSGDTIHVNGVAYTAGATTAGTTFTVTTGGVASANIEATAKALCDVINNADGTGATRTVNAFYISGPNDIPGKILLESTTLGGSAFAVYASRAESWNPQLPTTVGAAVSSTNDASPHAVYYSKIDEPEAVPLLNYLYVGAKNKELLRILPLRDKLYVFKEDGIFTIAGDDPFRVDLLDATARLLCPDSAVVLNNQIFALTTQGVVSVSDGGVQIMSRPIEESLQYFLTPTMQATIKRAAFGVALEADRQYQIWLPSSATGTECDFAWCLNIITNTWTTIEGLTRQHGVCSPKDQLYMLGSGLSVHRERKDGTFTDYVDQSVTDALGLTLVSGSSYSRAVSGGVYPQAGDGIRTTYAGSITRLYKVLSVNLTANTFTLNEVVTPGYLTINLERGIPCEVRWLPITGGMPGQSKRYTFGTFHFNKAQFQTGQGVYATEIATSDAPVALSHQGTFTASSWSTLYPFGTNPANVNIRHMVPSEKQRGALLTAGFKITEAYTSWRLHGLTLEMESVSERTEK